MRINSNTQYTNFILLMSAPSGLLLGILYFMFTGAPAVSCIFGSFLACLSMFSIVKQCEKNWEFVYILAIFAVKFALTAYQAKYKNLPLGGVDWANYHYGAQVVLERCNNIIELLFFNGKDLFTGFCALIYKLFGVHTMQINLYILASSFVAANYVYRSVFLLTDGNHASSFLAMLIFAIWPIDIIYSVTYLREMPVQMFTVISLYQFLVFMKSRRPIHLLGAFISIAFACMMHSGVIALVFVYIIGAAIGEGGTMRRLLHPRNLAIIVVALIILFVTPLWSMISAKLGDIDSAEDLVARSQQFTEGEASTRYVSDMPENMAQFILQMPYRALLFALVPLPWMVNSFSTGISWVLDALPQIWIIGRIIKLNRMCRNNKKFRFYAIMLNLCVIGTYLICGMGTTAYGNAIRHRAKILPIVLIFVVGLYSYIKNNPAVLEESET